MEVSHESEHTIAQYVHTHTHTHTYTHIRTHNGTCMHIQKHSKWYCLHCSGGWWYQGGARAYLTTDPGQHYWESCTLISDAERNSLLFQPLQTHTRYVQRTYVQWRKPAMHKLVQYCILIFIP